MLEQENRARIATFSIQIMDKEKGGVEARAPATSHSHHYSDLRDSRRYQPVDPLKEREHRPTRSSSVFDQLSDEADSHIRRAQFHDGRRVGSLPRDLIYELGYSYDDERDRPTRSFDEDLSFFYEIRSTPVPIDFVRPKLDKYIGQGDPMYHLEDYKIEM
ncbi:hypothetical protein Adt_34787 [Abeliophyllum distichum]|uniref:Uncharacterized protein n=1 Tax=Abeliophyllum distichum TaxID=126358 RepID=A0ABD1R048_9LAMI